MTEKDPKDMTASELLRWTANGENDEYGLSHVHHKLLAALAGKSFEKSTIPEDRENIMALADKIDAEIAEARRDAVKESKKPMWWFRSAIRQGEDWPEPHDGEKFREYLSRCFMPLPRHEDGEPVQLGRDGVSEIRFRRCYELCSAHTVECTILDDDGEVLAVVESGERVKRPAPEALGADGLPVKEGETVWDMASGLEIVVSRIAKDEGGNVIVCANGDICELQFAPKNITHTPPDTQERIDEDVRKEIVEYWDCVGVLCGDCPVKIDGKTPAQRYNAPGCETAKTLDLLRRQRELDARKGGE